MTAPEDSYRDLLTFEMIALLKRLLGGRPPGGIPMQQQVNELNRFGTGVNEHLVQRGTVELGELKVHFRRQLVAFRPLALEPRKDVKRMNNFRA